MGEAKITLTAQDNASAVIDRVSQKLGIFNKQGLAMGVSFALVNIAIQKMQEAFQRLSQEFMKGVERAKDFELNLVYVMNTMKDMNMTAGGLSDSLHEMSRTFGVDVNMLAIALKKITREGNSSSESIRILGQAQLFNTATGEDLNSILDALDTTMGVFDLDTTKSSYILEKLNVIVNTTGLSIGNISDIFGRLSPEIRKAGYNLSDVVDILYTLAQTEIGPRKMAPAFEEYLKGMGFEKIKTVPVGAVKSIEEQANAAINTHKKATDVIGAAWDGMWESIGQGALDTIDFLNTKWSMEGGLHKVIEKTVLPGLGKTNEPKENPFTQYFNNIKEAASAMPGLKQEIYDIRGPMNYMMAMRQATLEVEKQQNAIDALERISKQYNIEQQQASLDILRIQYGARGRRGGRLTRGEQREIYNIETDMIGMQIKEAENQLAINNIQVHGLQDALDEQDKIRRQHDATVYNEELSALQTSLDEKLLLWKKYYAAIHAMNPMLGRNIGETTTPESTVQQYQRGTKYRSYYDWRLR